MFDSRRLLGCRGRSRDGVEVARSAPQTLTLTLTSGTAFTPKVAQSTDGGGHWTVHDLSASLPAKAYSISLIAVDPDKPQKLFLRAGSAAGEVWRSAPTAARPPRRPLSLPGGALTAFTRLDSGTLLAAGVEGATTSRTARRTAGRPFKSCRRRCRCSALSARGTTVYAATDTSVGTAAIETSADEGRPGQPLMAYSDIQAIQTCVMALLPGGLLSRADMQQWSDAICSATAPVSAGGGGGGHASGGTAGHAGAGSGGAAGSPSGGGSSCDVGGGRWSWLAVGGRWCCWALAAGGGRSERTSRIDATGCSVVSNALSSNVDRDGGAVSGGARRTGGGAPNPPAQGHRRRRRRAARQPG